MPLSRSTPKDGRTPGRRCVIVIGSARSGTSWVGKALSYAPGFTYYREPDNHHEVNGAEERFAWAYFTPDRDDAPYRNLMSRASRGEIATAFTMCDDPGPLLRPLGTRGLRLGERYPILFLRKRHVLLKLVYANLNLSWLAARLPHAELVRVLRHPCGQFESWRRLGWEPQPAKLLTNQGLMQDHLGPFERLLGSARGFWERAGAYWGALAYVNYRQAEAGANCLTVAYEWLCADAVPRFQQVHRRLGLGWSARTARFLRSSNRPGDTSPYSLNRPTARKVDDWKRRLSREEIESCRRFVEPFDLPYYPGFEPTFVKFRHDSWSLGGQMERLRVGIQPHGPGQGPDAMRMPIEHRVHPVGSPGRVQASAGRTGPSVANASAPDRSHSSLSENSYST